MDERTLYKALSNIPIGGLHFFQQVGSTNDEALNWAAAGAPDFSIVYAEAQTKGRGRGKRTWITPPEVALAFSLILRPLPRDQPSTALFTALGALAVCEALSLHGLKPEIKWPNDVLLNRRKVCGILAESAWLGDKLDSIVLGIGVNVKPAAVPPANQLIFPATSIENELPPSGYNDQTVDRMTVFQQILQAILYWRNLVARKNFLHAWESRLAFRGEQVEIRMDSGDIRHGELAGLEPDGSLRLISPQGLPFTVQYGEVHLRPVV